jgi:hypothetical protein
LSGLRLEQVGINSQFIKNKDLAMEEPPSENNSTWWKRPFRWVGNAQLAGLVGITSLVLSLYFWIDQKVEPNLYGLSDTHNASQIVSASSPDLEVYYKRQLVTGDVFAQQIKLWNRGKRPIKPADILSPVFIEVAPSAKLLNARITNQARDVSDCKLSFEEPGTRSTLLSTARIITNKIYFSCKILESGDGATIQIIYEGPLEISLKLMGAIEGQRAILLENSLVRQPKSDPQIGSGKGYVWMVILLFTISLFILGILPREGVLGKLKKAISVFLLAMPFGLGVYASYYFLFAAPATPPF